MRFDLDDGDLAPLRVFGPAPTEEFIDRLVGSQGIFAPDILSRREHIVAQHNFLKRGGTLPRPGVKTEAHDIVSGAVVEIGTCKATAVCVPHLAPYLFSLAYRLDTKEGSILFLGDAGISPELIDLAKGVDTLITGVLPWNTRIGDPPDPHNGVSADIPDIIDLASVAGISRIVGIHGSPSEKDLTDTLRKGYDNMGYDGIVVCPEEMTSLDL